jgi:hypothetical protein
LLEPLLSNRLEGKGQRLNRLCVPPRDAEVLRRQDQGPQVKQVTFIKEKTMAPETGMIRTNRSAGVLWSLALALLLAALPARSETIDLACVRTTEPTASTSNIRILIDTDRRIVTEILKSGKQYEEPITMISAQFIRYIEQAEKGDVVGVDATIDRIAGTLTFDTVWKGKVSGSIVYACRRATQKF